MSAGVQPSRGSGAVSAEYRGGREEAGCSGWRTWDVYMVEDYETEDCATHLAPWLRLHLPESDTGLEPSLIEKEIARRCPFYPVLALDLLMQINGRPPVWIYLRSEQGYRMPLGLVPAVRVRAKTPFNDVLGVRKGAAPPPKMVLIYEAEADHDIDVRTRVPDRILALHYGQCSSSILNEVQAKLPGYHFEVFQPGKSSQEWTWEKLSLSLEPLLSTDVLRIKAVPQQSTQDCVKVVPVAHETMETLVRRRRHLQEPKRVYDS